MTSAQVAPSTFEMSDIDTAAPARGFARMSRSSISLCGFDLSSDIHSLQLHALIISSSQMIPFGTRSLRPIGCIGIIRYRFTISTSSLVASPLPLSYVVTKCMQLGISHHIYSIYSFYLRKLRQ